MCLSTSPLYWCPVYTPTLLSRCSDLHAHTVLCLVCMYCLCTKHRDVKQLCILMFAFAWYRYTYRLTRPHPHLLMHVCTHTREHTHTHTHTHSHTHTHTHSQAWQSFLEMSENVQKQISNGAAQMSGVLLSTIDQLIRDKRGAKTVCVCVCVLAWCMWVWLGRWMCGRVGVDVYMRVLFLGVCNNVLSVKSLPVYTKWVHE